MIVQIVKEINYIKMNNKLSMILTNWVDKIKYLLIQLNSYNRNNIGRNNLNKPIFFKIINKILIVLNFKLLLHFSKELGSINKKE